MGSGRPRDNEAGVTRRNFLKLGAAMGGMAALQGASTLFVDSKKRHGAWAASTS